MSLFRFCVSVLVDFLKICLLHEMGQVTFVSLLIHVESCILRFMLTDNFLTCFLIILSGFISLKSLSITKFFWSSLAGYGFCSFKHDIFIILLSLWLSKHSSVISLLFWRKNPVCGSACAIVAKWFHGQPWDKTSNL